MNGSPVYSIIGFNAAKVINLLLDSFCQAKSSNSNQKHCATAGTGLQTCTIICMSPDVCNQKKMSSLIFKNQPSPTKGLPMSFNIVHDFASGDAGILVQVWRLVPALRLKADGQDLG